MKYNLKYLLLLIVLTGLVQSLHAQSTKRAQDSIRTLNILKNALNKVKSTHVMEENDIGLEIDGLIIDETISKIGRDFFELFYSIWEPPGNAVNYSVRINEKITPGMATQITFYVNDTELFKQKVQPRYDYLEKIAKYVNQKAYNYLANYELMKKQLENEDQQGTGLY